MSTEPDLADVVSHTQLSDGIEALSKLVVLMPVVVLVTVIPPVTTSVPAPETSVP